MVQRVQPVAPADSPSYRKFVDLLLAAGQDETAARELMWQLGAHPLLVGHAEVFYRVLEAFRSPTFSAGNLSWASHWKLAIPGWIELLEWLQTERPRLAKLIPRYDPQAALNVKRPPHPLVGIGVDAIPLVAGLWNRHEWRDSSDPVRARVARRYALLQRHALAFYLETRFRSRGSLQGWEQHKSDMEYCPQPLLAANAGRALRAFSLAEYHSEVNALPDEPNTSTWVGRLVAAEGYSEDLHIFLGHLPKVLEQAILEPRRRAEHSRTSGKGGRPRVHGYVPFQPDGELVIRETPPEEEIPGVIRIGRPPSVDEDGEPDERYVELLHPAEINGALSRAKSSRMSAQMEAQQFHWNDSQLLPSERSHLVEKVRARLKAWNQARTDVDRDRLRRQAQGALLGLLGLFLGQPPEQSCRITMRLLRSAPGETVEEAFRALLDEQLDDTVLVVFDEPPQTRSRARGAFVVPCLAPVLVTDPTGALPFGRATVRNLYLPIPEHSALQWVLDNAPRPKELKAAGKTTAGSIDLGRVFTLDPEEANRVLGEFLSAIEPRGSSGARRRLTPAHVCSALPSMLYRLSGESTFPWLICRQTRRRGEARLHYTQHRILSTCDLYLRALHHLGLLGAGVAKTIRTVAPLRVGLEDVNVGARFVMRRDSLAGLLSGLRDTLKKAPAPRSNQALLDYHDAYLLYVVITQAFHAALRSVNEPTRLITANQVIEALHPAPWNEAATRVAGISDKDTIFVQKARLVEISPSLQEQLIELQHHLVMVARRLPDHAILTGAHAALPVFELDERLRELRSLPVTTQWVEKQLASRGFPVPGNFARGFLRTELLERGCPAQSVDALLGHHGTGESPFGTFSTFDYEQHRRIVARHLKTLHEEIGLAPIRSKVLAGIDSPLPLPWADPARDHAALLRIRRPAAISDTPSARGAGGKSPTNGKREDRISTFWKGIARHASRDDDAQVEPFLAFLDGMPRNCFALLLRNPPDKAPQDPDPGRGSDLEAGARQVEEEIVKRILDGALADYDAGSWLRLIQRAGNALRADGHTMPVTYLLAALRSASSPFSPDALQGVTCFEYWRRALWRWIEKNRDAAPPGQQALVAVLLSSVMHGALLDRAKLSLVIAALATSTRRELHCSHGRAFMEFVLSMNTVKERQYHRWWLDPLSEMLWLRVPPMSEVPSLRDVRLTMLDMLRDEGVPEHLLPRGWTDLLVQARRWWRTRASSVDVLGAQRFFASHSIRSGSWLRIAGGQRLLGPPLKGASPTPTNDVEAESIGDEEEVPESQGQPDQREGEFENDDANQESLLPWLTPLLDLVERGALADVDAGILAIGAADPAGAVFVRWAKSMSEEAGEALSNRGVAVRLRLVSAALVGTAGLVDFASLDASAWAELMTEVLGRAQVRGTAGQDFVAGLRSLSTLLGFAEDPTVADALRSDDIEELLHVDARVFTVDEYERAMEYLKLCKAPVMTMQERSASRLVLMLSFRLGLRPGELHGLRLCDVVREGGLDFLVRPYPGHRVKSVNGQRRLPLQLLLSPSERKSLRDWVARLLKCPGAGPESPLVVAHYDSGERLDRERIDSILNDVLRSALGDPDLRLYHARHSFATWTSLALRSVDHEELFELLEGSPRTVLWLRRGRRMRQWLFGSAVSTERRIAFAMSRLLGHVGPGVSYMHYLHGDDLIRASLTGRATRDVPRTVWIAASGLKHSAAYEALAVGTRRLVERARARHGWTVASQTHSEDSAPFPESVQSDWVSSDTVRALLRMTETEGVSLERAASLARLSVVRAERIIRSAKEGLVKTAPPGATNRQAASKGELTRWQAATDVAKFLSRLELEVAKWWDEDPAECTAALRQLVDCYYRTYRDFVVKDAATLKAVLGTMRRMRISPEQVKLIVRRPPSEAPSLPGWAVGQMASYSGCWIRRINPQVMAKASSYSKWLGLLFVDQKGEGIGLAIARELVLVLAGLDSATSD